PMRIVKYLWRYGNWLKAAMALMLSVGIALSPVRGGFPAGGTTNPPPLCFSNAFYFENRLNPANIWNPLYRALTPCATPSCSVVDNSNTDPTRRNIRVLSTTGGFDHEGNPLYYNIFGMVMPNTFTPNQAGRDAMDIANFFSAYIFPKASGTPLSPALSNRRQ